MRVIQFHKYMKEQSKHVSRRRLRVLICNDVRNVCCDYNIADTILSRCHKKWQCLVRMLYEECVCFDAISQGQTANCVVGIS